MNRIVDFVRRVHWQTWLALVMLVVLLWLTSSPWSSPERAAFSTISSQQQLAAQTSFAGVVDPTQIAGPSSATGHALTACSSSCGSTLSEQNRAAIKATVDYASTARVRVHIPPNEYSVACSSGHVVGVDITGSNLDIDARGAVFRFTGDQASSDCAMLRVLGSNVRIEGLTVSMRDITNATTSSVGIAVGDGGTTVVDNVQLVDVQFVEGVGGDFLRIDGGANSPAKVSRVIVERSRFEGSARGGIVVRPGTERIAINYNFFRANANRDIWFENTGDGVIGKATVLGNFIETDKANPAMTLSGNGGANVLEQSVISYNRIVPPISAGMTGGGTVEGSALGRTVIFANHIITNRSSAQASLQLTGSVSDVLVSANDVDRRTSAGDAAAIKITDDGVTAPTNVTIRENRVHQYSGASPGIDVSGTQSFQVVANKVTYHSSTADSGATGFVGVYCAGSALAKCAGSISRNIIRRQDQDINPSLNLATVTTHDDSVVQFFRAGQEGNGATIAFVGDSGTTAGSITGTSLAKTVHFRPSFSTVANIEALMKQGSILVKTTGTQANVLQVGDAFAAHNLAGGTQAGRMLAGIRIVKDPSNHVGALTLRDNIVDGARAEYYSNADGADFVDGAPLISGGQPVNVTNEFEGGIATWLTETTTTTETIVSGACSTVKDTTFITTSGTQSYTQADGVRDGARHCFKVKSVTGTPIGTWTPTHFADGTTHTITWTSATDVSWCVVWDATSTTYRLVSKAAGATLN